MDKKRKRKRKLTEEDVRSIRDRIRGRRSTIDEIAAEYDLTPNYVWEIVAGRAWKHVA